jgi:acetyl-CoA C-acetyltransferase
MHGIASMVEILRADPGSFGVVGANGGVLSKHSVGVYSTTAVADWRPCDSRPLQASIDALPAPPFTHEPRGTASVESYTVVCGSQGPKYGVIIGRLDATNERFFAQTAKGDDATPAAMVERDPLGMRIVVDTRDAVSTFAIADGC